MWCENPSGFLFFDPAAGASSSVSSYSYDELHHTWLVENLPRGTLVLVDCSSHLEGPPAMFATSYWPEFIVQATSEGVSKWKWTKRREGRVVVMPPWTREEVSDIEYIHRN